jgi:hypothetical protein
VGRLGNSDHEMALNNLETSVHVEAAKNVRNRRKANWYVRQEMKQTDWEKVMACKSVQEMWFLFKEKINSRNNNNVPWKDTYQV